LVGEVVCEGGGAKIDSRPAGAKRSRCSPYATSPCRSLRFHSGVSFGPFCGDTLTDLLCWIVSYGADRTDEVDTDLDKCRPRVLLDISWRSLEGRRIARCEVGILLSLGLRSTRALLLLLFPNLAIAQWRRTTESTYSRPGIHDFFWGLYLGMRLEGTQEASEVLLFKDGSDGGDPDDRGCDTQSSERESNHT
jgi:hypothetical protein